MPVRKTAPDDKSTTVVVVTNGAAPRPRRKKKQSPTEKLKRKIARVTGIPTPSAGRKKKAARKVADFLMDKIDALTGKKK